MFPIIYVRGYAATMQEINATTADPYMGFNLGSAALRQDFEGNPIPFIFESPLLRLLKNEGYVDAFRNGGCAYGDAEAPMKSVWVFRYYERASTILGNGERASMGEFAADLRGFILKVRKATCGNDPEKCEAFRIYLVAHSMGGLVCRCYLQNICRYGAPNPTHNADLELVPGKDNAHFVDRVYTYATPHNGIDFAGINAPDFGALDKLQIANFNRERMAEYLKLPANGDVNSLDGAFPPERFFCLIGTDYRDYDAFAGLSKMATGPMSDGLVMIENAYVDKAPRAFVFRSHSGTQGIVNSETGYQNLRRFLFGDVRVTVTLEVKNLYLPPSMQEQFDAGKHVRGSYYFDAAAQVRGAVTYFLSERRYTHQSALLEPFDELIKERKPVYLFTGYLLASARAGDDRALMFSIDLGVRVPTFEVDREFWFKDHFEGFLYQDTITFALRDATIRYGLASQHGIGDASIRAEEKEQEVDASIREIRIPIGTPVDARPGFQGILVLRVDPWGE